MVVNKINRNNKSSILSFYIYKLSGNHPLFLLILLIYEEPTNNQLFFRVFQMTPNHNSYWQEGFFVHSFLPYTPQISEVTLLSPLFNSSPLGLGSGAGCHLQPLEFSQLLFFISCPKPMDTFTHTIERRFRK